MSSITEQRTLLRNGIILTLGDGDMLIRDRADILVASNRIERVERPGAISLDGLNGASLQVIDCEDTIITPGFIDAHRHNWQTQLRGRHADQLYQDYLPTGQKAFVYYDADDSRLAELAGALEAIAAGTTTMLDFNHNVSSREALEAGAEGLIDSGVRAVYCIGPRMVPKKDSYDTETIEPMIPEWFYEMYTNLAHRTLPEKSAGRVQIGFNLDYIRFPQHADGVADLYARVCAAGGTHLASYHDFGPVLPSSAIVERGLDMANMVSAHANNQPPEYYAQLSEAGAHFVTTPSTELQMGFGDLVCFSKDVAGKRCGLGVDCHSVTAGSLASEARIGLQAYRASRHKEEAAKGQQRPADIHASVHDAFRLLTVGGAQVLKMGEKIGRIRQGMFADLLIWDATSPAMVAAAQQDPVAAVVMHSSPADLKHVMIDGEFRKYDGKLLPVRHDGATREWSDVAKAILESRDRIGKRIEAADRAAGRLA